MTTTLVRFYNAVSREGYYLKRRVRSLDVMLEKGKVPIIGKFRTMQLIEVELQLLMRISIGERIEGVIENDNRMSKFDCRSLPYCSIENSILEKHLMSDLE